jgi:hypothetical protein
VCVAANNNIKRNSQMVAALCAEFAEANTLGSVSGNEYHAFPSLAQIATLRCVRYPWPPSWLGPPAHSAGRHTRAVLVAGAVQMGSAAWR